MNYNINNCICESDKRMKNVVIEKIGFASENTISGWHFKGNIDIAFNYSNKPIIAGYTVEQLTEIYLNSLESEKNKKLIKSYFGDENVCLL